MAHRHLIIALFVSFVFYAPVPTFADDVQSPVADKYLDIQTVESKGGITAWLVEDHSIPIIAMSYAFKDAGAKNDPADKQGLARLSSNTMDEGAGNLDSYTFQKMLRDYSVTLNFSATRDHFTGQLKTLTENKSIAFNLLKNALISPRFDEEPVSRMRAANQSRIKSSSSNPDWIAARIQNDVIFDGHSYAMNSGGTIRSLESITTDDLRGFHKTLGRNQLIIGVVGDISAAELSVTLDNVFGEMPIIETKEPTQFDLKNAGKTYLYDMDIPQTVIEISQKGVRQSDDDYFASKVMNFILGESGFGSRLMEEIREKRGLTYGIYSYFREYEETPVFHISTSTANKNVSEMLELINVEIGNIKGSNVGEAELAEAKSYLIGSLPLSLTSTDSIAGVLTSLQMDGLPIDYLDTRASHIDAVSAEDIQAAASRIFNERNFTTILVGAPEEVIEFEKVTTLPNVE
ncbi:MAG: M16 family metallopeptidase [Alphaproteobacteria bacterium]